MATVTQFIVWAPDCTDADGLKRRLSVRPSHLENVHRLTKEGIVRLGGGLLSTDSVNTAPGDRKIIGSCFIIEAKSLEAARNLVKTDIYYTTGVWDREKLQILPIALVTSLPPVPA